MTLVEGINTGFGLQVETHVNAALRVLVGRTPIQIDQAEDVVRNVLHAGVNYWQQQGHSDFERHARPWLNAVNAGIANTPRLVNNPHLIQQVLLAQRIETIDEITAFMIGLQTGSSLVNKPEVVTQIRHGQSEIAQILDTADADAAGNNIYRLTLRELKDRMAQFAMPEPMTLVPIIEARKTKDTIDSSTLIAAVEVELTDLLQKVLPSNNFEALVPYLASMLALSVLQLNRFPKTNSVIPKIQSGLTLGMRFGFSNFIQGEKWGAKVDRDFARYNLPASIINDLKSGDGRAAFEIGSFIRQLFVNDPEMVNLIALTGHMRRNSIPTAALARAVGPFLLTLIDTATPEELTTVNAAFARFATESGLHKIDVNNIPRSPSTNSRA